MKQLSSFMLPITVLVVVPLCIEHHFVCHIPTLLLGFLVIGVGLYVMWMTIGMFIRIGKGTLAPWAPTKKLVVVGIYRYVRNPMIMGVLTVLTGEAIAFLSARILVWALVFFLINNAFFLLYEEPNLEKKFGEEYREYKRMVPRWIPRKINQER